MPARRQWRRPIRADRSRWSFRCRRAAPTTSWRARSPTSSAPRSASRSWSKTARAGGSGTVGTRQVAKAAPDGYTILLGLYVHAGDRPEPVPNVGYDPRKDFAPIGLIASAPTPLLLVHPSLPVRATSPELDRDDEEREPLRSRSALPASARSTIWRRCCSRSRPASAVQQIPYKGSNPLTTDLVGGHVKVGFNPIPVSRAAIEGKLIVALAGTSLKRSTALRICRPLPNRACPASMRC